MDSFTRSVTSDRGASRADRRGEAVEGREVGEYQLGIRVYAYQQPDLHRRLVPHQDQRPHSPLSHLRRRGIAGDSRRLGHHGHRGGAIPHHWTRYED